MNALLPTHLRELAEIVSEADRAMLLRAADRIERLENCRDALASYVAADTSTCDCEEDQTDDDPACLKCVAQAALAHTEIR